MVRTALAAGSLAVAAVLLARPGPARSDLTYGSISATRDATWLGYLVDMVGLVVAAFALGLTVCTLATGRGRHWATVGAVMTTLGGLLFGSAPYAMAVMFFYVTDTVALSPETGTAFVDHVADNLGHVVGPQLPGFLLLNVGILLLATALWRARAVPRWLPVVMAVLTVGQFGPWSERLLDLEQAALMLSFVVLAWFAGRRPVNGGSTA